MEIILDPLKDMQPEQREIPRQTAPEPPGQPTPEEPAQPQQGPEKPTAQPAAKTKKRRKGRWIALAVIALLLGGILFAISHNWTEPIMPAESQNPYITPLGVTMVSAHRSGGGIFPENTMMAFENCINAENFRTDIFEFDLHITKDGQLIILHDDTLDRTTDSAFVFGVSGARPEDYTLGELKALNFGAGFTDASGNQPYADLHGDQVPPNLRVATLTDVLDYLEENGGFRYIIEIKNSRALGYLAADRLYAVLQEKDLLQKAVIGTFKGEITKYISQKYPDMLRSASIAEVIGFYLDSLFKTERPEGYYKFTALQIPANQFFIKLGTARLVNYAHKNGLAVQYWTINDADTIRYLKSINADCVMSDVPDLAFSVLYDG